MTSDLPAASSSQQPFANPQPAPITPAHQAASPPAENLKSWWARFRKDRPKHETQGNYFHDPSFESRHLNTNFGEWSMEVLSQQSCSFMVRPSSPTSSIPDTLQLRRPAMWGMQVKNAHLSLPTIETTKCDGDIVDRPTGIFGVPLRQSITYANVAISLVDPEGKSYIYGYVPIVVAKCGVYLKEKATNVEGIFRLSGSEKRIKELKTIFDSPDRYGKGLDWNGYTVHDAANVLRRYLNQLPEPIVPLDLYDRFREPLRGHVMQAVGDNEGMQLPDTFDVNKAIVTYQRLITELPPLNRQLLLYILDLLAVFASKADENRMNSQNLAAIFQPGMLSHPSHDMAPSEYRLSQDVLIFLIENQDNFLIGMRGTAADEQTVQEVSGGTPPPGTPSTPSKSKMVGRSASNASAGADSIRKFGGVRRNVSVSSRNSRQSNGAPSPASPAYGGPLTHNNSGGIHRSNTVPSKKSPGLPSSRLQKNSGSPSPTGAMFVPKQGTVPRSLSPAHRPVAPSSPGLVPASPMGKSSLAPSSQAPSSAVTSQERLLGAHEHGERLLETPAKERTVSNLFNRSPTADSERRQPNKLRKNPKRRIPSSSNPSAHSSTNSLHAQQHSTAVSPAFLPTRGPQDLVEHPVLESMAPRHPEVSNTEPTPPVTETPRADPLGHQHEHPQEHNQSSDQTLKPIISPPTSVHSHSSFNDHSDMDHGDEQATMEQKEKRSLWRLSRQRDNSQNLGSSFSPKKGMGSDAGAGASSSSVGSALRPRKSFTGDTVPVGSESTLVAAHPQPSNESGNNAGTEEKRGLLGRFKNKFREKREEKEAEKERTKSPPASERMSLSTTFPARAKSIEIPREPIQEKVAEESAPSQTEQPLR
ncbi:Rho-GTPase-activating protein 5 [Lachnellula arida]|uniref:Rho-GTPase-activating protein 5 n=1 Tax=Lachnellula arida TaxID=1316785 RepID=A0A8T9B6J0_9HELO|nr:Rho-GTPase-activating protein 5 [Lachnellula arida]